MHKRIASLAMTGLLLISAAACSGNAATDAGDTETEVSDAASTSETTIIGQVAEIDGDTITLALGTFETPSDMSMPDGQADDAMMGDGAPDGGAMADEAMIEDTASEDIADTQDENELPAGDGDAPAMPSGDFELPEGAEDGAAPDGQGVPSGGFGFTATGETQTITVTSDTVITLGRGDAATAGTVSDIAVDDYITVTLSGSDVTAIVVNQLGGMGGMNGGGMPEGGEMPEGAEMPKADGDTKEAEDAGDSDTASVETSST